MSGFRLRFAAVLALVFAPWFAARAEAFPTLCGSTWSSYQNTASVTVPPGIVWGQHFHIRILTAIYGDTHGGYVSLPMSFNDGPPQSSDQNPSGSAYSTSYGIANIVPPNSLDTDLPGTLIPGNHYFRGNDSYWAVSCITTVSKNDTATSLTTSTTTPTYGDAVRFSATVAAPTLPTGTIDFAADGTSLGAATLARGPASGSIAVGDAHACAVTASGGVSCWGANGSGQIGDGTTTLRSTPTAVPGPTNVVAVAAGTAHSCALDASGGIACWGADAQGQLGDGGATPQASPVTIAASGFSAIAAGANHTCAITTGGAVACWGDNGQGQIGSAALPSSATPAAVAGFPGNAVAIAAGGDHSCALVADGTIWCWGANAHGELGDGTTTSRATATQVAGLAGMTALAAGTTHTCGLDASGAVWCWGSNGHGELGGADTSDQTIAVSHAGLSGQTAITAGNGHSCSIDATGAAWCWGAGANGRLGNGATDDQTTPVAVSGLPEQISTFQLNMHSGPSYTAGAAAIVAGNGRTYVVTDIGAVRGFGANADGGLGDGTSTDRSSPVAVTDYITTRLAAVARLTTSAMLGGDRSVTANYGGDGYRQTSTSPATTVSVAKAASVTSLALSSSEVTVGAGVGLTATVTPSSATGSVEFFDGVTSLGSATLSGGTAALSVSTLAVGAHALSAVYSGDGNHVGSTSPAATETVDAIATSLVLTTSSASSVRGSAVTFTATVTPSNAAGSVNFRDGSTTLGTATLSAGVATLTVSTLTVGSHSMSAVYGGDTTHATSTSSVVSQTVVKAPTSLLLFPAATTAVWGQSVTLVAIAVPSTATGTVTFKDGSSALGTATLSAGSASLSVASLAVGAHTLTAAYSGDGDQTAATSSAVTATVAKGGTTTTLSSSAATVLPGGAVTLSALTTVTAPSTGTADGTIAFAEGATALTGATLASGAARGSTTLSLSGTHVLKATYGGSSRFLGSVGSASVAVDARLGTPQRVNATTTGVQDGASAAVLGAGGLVVVWSSVGQDGSGRGVYGRLFTAAGVARGSEFRVATTTAGDQTSPRVAALDTGGFVVVWQSPAAGGGRGVFMRRFAATGAAIGSETAVDTSTGVDDRIAPAVASLASGDYVVVWQAPVAATGRTMIRGRLHTDQGVPKGTEFRADTSDTTSQSSPVVDATANGGFVVAWSSTGGAAGAAGIRGQRFAADGTRLGKEFAISPTTTATRSQPAIAGTADGGFVAAWTSLGQTGAVASVFARRFSATGVAAGAETRLNGTVDVDQIQPSVAAFPGGGHVFAWTRRVGTTAATVRWRRHHADGTPSDVEQTLTLVGGPLATQPVVVTANDLAFAFAFTAGPSATATEIWLQRAALAAAAP